MNQMTDMKVNPLPARTWNWLHMNESDLQEAAITEQGNVSVEKPESVEFVTEKKSRLADIAEIKTGMGKEMDAFAEAGNVAVQVFTTREGKKEEQPLRLAFSYPDKSRTMNRLEFRLRKGSELTVVMDFTSEKNSEGCGAVQTKVYAEEGAVLHLIQVQRLGEKVTLLDDFGAECKKEAEIKTIQLILGGKDTYLGNHTALQGEKSSLESEIGYLTGKESRLDMNLVAVHTGKKTVSQMDATGVLRQKAKKIFRGTIDFRKGCAGSVGNEKEDVLLLDDTIVNQTIPLILCEEEDVEGNHGATIGKIDEELLFYLESRGIQEEDIYTMMAKARIQAICQKISDEQTRETVQNYLDQVSEEEPISEEKQVSAEKRVSTEKQTTAEEEV